MTNGIGAPLCDGIADCLIMKTEGTMTQEFPRALVPSQATLQLRTSSEGIRNQ